MATTKTTKTNTKKVTNTKTTNTKKAPKKAVGTAKKPAKKRKLTDREYLFIDEYMKHFNATKAYITAYGYDNREDVNDPVKRLQWGNDGRKLRDNPLVLAEINKRREEMHSEAIAQASEVMQYFTSVMRGELRDQFGLDAPLSERTKAAQELARRTVDLDAAIAGRTVRSGTGQVNITLDFNGL